MKVLTAAEMREVDRLTTERYGISGLQLMESAGVSVAAACRDLLAGRAARAKICVLCGKGNNGGDGLVAARHLQGHAAQLKVYLFGDPQELRGDAAVNLQRWSQLGNPVTSITDEKSWKTAWTEIAASDVIIDAIFGTGFRGVVSGVIAEAIQAINVLSQRATAARPALIVAVDTPSGLPSDGQDAEGPVLHVHHTVTFTAPKPGQLISADAVAAGALRTADIGSPWSLIEELGASDLRWVEPRDFANFPLVRTVDSHKGLYGHALIVAGSLGKSGAAAMASYGALRAGAGLVTAAVPDAVLPLVATAHPELMTELLVSTTAGTAAMRNFAQDRISEIAGNKTVVAVGPGLGLETETQEFIRRLVREVELPTILDADGLNAFAGNADALRDRRSKFLAITPHPGEMGRLLLRSAKDIQRDRVKTAEEAARRWNAHVILKGSHTILAAPQGSTFINTSGNPGLAKGGSGDVLTGILAGLTAQFKTSDWLSVLALGVYLHGKAAEIATRNTDESGLLATEVADALPLARRELLRELQQRG